MDTSSRYLLVFLVLSVVISIFVTYWDTMVQKDFVVLDDLEDASFEDEMEPPQ